MKIPTEAEEGKIIDAKETANYIIVTLKGKYGVKLEVIEKRKWGEKK